MIVEKSEKFIEDTIILEEGVDYQKSDLCGNAFVGNKLKELPANKLLEIAQKKGYDRWSWNGFEKNGKVEVKFRKELK